MTKNRPATPRSRRPRFPALTVVPMTVLAVLALALAAPAVANEYEDQIKDQLVLAATFYTEEGFEPSHEPIIDTLDGDASASTTVELEAGNTYAIVAVCDVDCSDVDLKLYDSGGTLVDEDVLVDDAPVIVRDIERTASYRIETIMYECGYEPCYYGVALFSRPTPSGGGEAGGDGEVDYEGQITRQLDVVRSFYAKIGFDRFREPLIDSLDEEATHSQSVELATGRRYVAFAVCDEDCTDIDLEVFDASGELVTEDTLTDDTPVVAIEVPRAGRYRIDTTVYECSYEPCYFGVEMMSEPGRRPKR